MQVGIHKIAMAAPDDVSGLATLIATGTIDPATIVAVIGKTEGNGGANDFTRALASLSVARCLAPQLGLSIEAVMERVALVWSGGTEGVLSPHATIFTREPSATASAGKRLALGIARTGDIAPEAIGTMVHVEAVAAAVRAAMQDAAIGAAEDVHYVQVKGPLLSPAKLADAAARGVSVVTSDPNGSKAFARGAMGLGVALGLGEIPPEKVSDAVIARDFTIYSSVASTSAGGELTQCEVLLFGNSEQASGSCRVGHAVLDSVIDSQSVSDAIRNAGLDFDGALPKKRQHQVVALFAKAEAATSIGGRRTTMNSDADINYERHARAALGAVIASVTNDPAIFVSGGTEHQCPPGKAPIAAIVRLS
jgi:cyanuric acid amidohydrolase